MCKKIFKFIFFCLAFFFAFIGLFLLSLRLRIFNENFLKTPLRESGVYAYAPKIIAGKLQEGLDQIDEQEPASGDLVNPFESHSFSKKLTTQIMLDIVEDPDLEGVVQTAVETNIDRLYAWLNSNAEDVYLYIPQTELAEIYDQDKLLDSGYSLFLEESGINKLPECPAGYVPIDALIQGDEFNISSLECQNQELRELVKIELERQLPEEDFNFVDAIFTANGINGDAELALSELATETDTEKAQYQEQMQMAQRWISMSFYLIILIIVISLILALIASLLSEHPRLKIIPKVYFFAGLLMVVIGGLFTYTLNFTIANLAPLHRISLPEQLVSESERMEIFTILENFITSFVSSLFQFTLIVGVAVTIISLLVWIIVRLTAGEETKATKKST